MIDRLDRTDASGSRPEQKGPSPPSRTREHSRTIRHRPVAAREHQFFTGRPFVGHLRSAQSSTEQALATLLEARAPEAVIPMRVLKLQRWSRV
jgi:hypothetical protein